MDGPTFFSMLCQTDAEYKQLHARLDILSTRKFRIVTGDSDYVGCVIRDFKFDPISRLIQIQFLENLMTELRITPPFAGVPFDFEPTFMQLEEFLNEHSS